MIERRMRSVLTVVIGVVTGMGGIEALLNKEWAWGCTLLAFGVFALFWASHRLRGVRTLLADDVPLEELESDSDAIQDPVEDDDDLEEVDGDRGVVRGG